MIPNTAMVLAAGLGTRMRPLTDDRPKALVTVGGRALIDHVLDRLVEVGVRRAVVNAHAFADMLEAHVRRRTNLEIIVSDERDLLLETGGGVRKALPLLGDAPVFVCNIDSVWEERGGSAVRALAMGFDPARMGARLLVVSLDRQIGYESAGDFFMDETGLLSFRDALPHSPWAYMGVQVIDPAILRNEPLEPFSFTRVWRRLAKEGRLHGGVLDGFWMHVGDPAARDAAEARLATAAPRA